MKADSHINASSQNVGLCKSKIRNGRLNGIDQHQKSNRTPVSTISCTAAKVKVYPSLKIGLGMTPFSLEIPRFIIQNFPSSQLFWDPAVPKGHKPAAKVQCFSFCNAPEFFHGFWEIHPGCVSQTCLFLKQPVGL